MVNWVKRSFSAIVALLMVFSIFTASDQFVLGDTGGPQDSGEQTADGLTIYNNSTDHWNISSGDDLDYDSSKIMASGNITLNTASSLKLTNSTINITGWLDVKPNSSVFLINSTLNIWGDIILGENASFTSINSSIVIFTSFDGQYIFYGKSNSVINITDWDSDFQSEDDASELISGTSNQFKAFFNWSKQVDIHNSVVKNCGFQSAVLPIFNAGMLVRSNKTAVSGTLFENCHTGLIILDTSGASVMNSTFMCTNGLALLNVTNCQVSGNAFIGETTDILTWWAREIEISHNSFQGTYDTEDMNDTAVDNVLLKNSTIHNNTIIGKGKFGIAIEISLDNTFKNNEIMNCYTGFNITQLSLRNTIDSNTIQECQVGISLNNSKRTEILNNEILSINTTSILSWENSDAYIGMNSFNSSEKALFDLDSSNIHFSNNTVENCSGSDILTHGSLNLTISENSLENMSKFLNSSIDILQCSTGDMYLINTTCLSAPDATGTSVVTTKWFLHLSAENAFGLPLIGAEVVLKDVNENEIINTTLGSSGKINNIQCIQTILEGNSSEILYITPHTLGIAYGELYDLHEFYVNSSMSKEFEMGVEDILTDWTVTDYVPIINKDLIINGNITIAEGGVLSLSGTDLNLQVPENGKRRIVIENGGQMILAGNNPEKNNITSTVTDGNHQYNLIVESGGILQMNHMKISHCGFQADNNRRASSPMDFLDQMGLFVASDNVLISNCEFTDNYCGLIFNSSINPDTVLSSSRFKNCENGLIVANSNINIQDITMYGITGNGITVFNSTQSTSLESENIRLYDIPGKGIVVNNAHITILGGRITNTSICGLTLEKGAWAHVSDFIITENHAGVEMDSSASLFEDVIIKSSVGYDISLTNNSNATLVNTIPYKYQIPQGDDSIIWDKYYVTFISKDDMGYRIPYTRIDLKGYRDLIPPALHSSHRYSTDHSGETDPVRVVRQTLHSDNNIQYYYDIISSKMGFSTGLNSTVIFTNETKEWTVVVNDITEPNVDAGGNDWIYQGSNYEFDGTWSVDNQEITNYTWSFNYSQNLVRLYGPHPSYQFDIPGDYIVKLTVKDRQGNSGWDTMLLEVVPVPFFDTITVTSGAVSATLHFVNRGNPPVLNLNLINDPGVISNPEGTWEVGLYFTLDVQGIEMEDWDYIEIGVNYYSFDISKIFTEEGLDLYTYESDTWVRADAFSSVDTVNNIIKANVTREGTFGILGPMDVTPPYIIMNLAEPLPESNNVPVNTDIEAVFSEEISNVGDDGLLLKGQDGDLIDGILEVKGSTISFDPGNDLDYEEQYHITILGTMEDKWGNDIGSNITWSFKTEKLLGELKVLEHYPDKYDSSIKVDTSINIVFNQELSLSNVKENIVLLPALNVNYLLINNNHTLIIVPEENLFYGYNFSVTIKSTLKSKAGHMLGREYIINFSTEEKKESPIKTEEKDDFELDLYLASTLVLIISIIVLLFMMYMTFRKQREPEDTEELFQDDLTYCPNCGEEADHGDSICSQCGTNLFSGGFQLNCPKCDTKLEPSDEKCPACGNEFDKLSTKGDGKKTTGKEEKDEKCPFCGAEVKLGDGSCPECGNIWMTKEGKGICDNCGASVDRDENFCPFCGDELWETEMICSECGTPISEDISVCPGCGERFDDDIEFEFFD